MTPQPHTSSFTDGLSFELDPFQVRAIDALAGGRSVLVAAPTGAGKTVVGEFACHAAVEGDGKVFYTTPIKALSNQKFRDLVATYGPGRVGLLTGDRSINGEAPVVVMTTEVLRNMIYERSSTLRGLRYAVLDEVHYLGDRARGSVWEEVIVQVPASVQIVALSATVSNAEELGDWLATVRNGCDVVIEEHRPIPLRHHYYVNGRVYDLFRTGRASSAAEREAARQGLAGVPNPEVVVLERQARLSAPAGRPRRRGKRPPRIRLRWPSRPEVVEELARRAWLPAIMFVFSRQGCTDAVAQLVRDGIRLTSAAERDEIAATLDTLLDDIPAEDLAVLGYAEFRDALLRGLAPHHAGLVPAFKEAVEVCFQRGLLRVVVATETLALGINMPARTVVIERLEKWDGERHTLLTPGQYTQLTGRAGRRGIDRVGHAVVLHQRDVDFHTVAGLVATRSYPLTSTFRPSYNMAVNLLRQHTLEQAEALLAASFAQFQADQAVATEGHRLVEAEEGLAGYARHLVCERGDWSAYWQLRTHLDDLEGGEERRRRRADERARRQSLLQLHPGDVVHLPWAGRRGLAAVTDVRTTRKGIPVAHVVVDDRQLHRLGPRELDGPVEPWRRIQLPDAGNPRQREYRIEVAHALADLPEPPLRARPSGDGMPSPEVVRRREQVEVHPCHGCPDRAEHERWQRRSDELATTAEGLRRTIGERSGSLTREFHRIVSVLREIGYLDEAPAPTDHGLRLAGIYGDVDLLVAESIRHGLLTGVDAAELAGICALFVYESRGDAEPERVWLPTETLRSIVGRIHEMADSLVAREQAAGVPPLRELDVTFVPAAYRWARGLDLEAAIGDLDLTGGDFVRWIKQAADLAGQIREVAGLGLADVAAETVRALRRGIVEG